MPVIKSAKKKLRQDKKRQIQNKGFKTLLKSLIKKALVEKSEDSMRLAVQAADKAAKKNVIHKNKASRIKSRLANALAKKVAPTEEKVTKSKKTTSKKNLL